MGVFFFFFLVWPIDRLSVLDMESSSSSCLVAVHVGAGRHSFARSSKHLAVCSRACLAAMEILKKVDNSTIPSARLDSPTTTTTGTDAEEAVVAAILILEKSPLTNAGRGSNLTRDGR